MNKRIAKPASIGIDLGGSKIAGVLIDGKGRVLSKFTRPTEAHKKRDDIISNVLEVINLLKAKGVRRIGIGVPGLCDSNGKLIYIPNVPALRGVNLKRLVEKRLDMPAVINNDANCFTFAEAKIGAARGLQNVIGVVIGTGVGSGLYLDGKIYAGKQGGAGELGHAKMISRVGKEVHLREAESLISGSALLKKYSMLSSKKPASIKDVSLSDKHFRRSYSEFVNDLSVFFANIINTFNPQVIVVGGGVSNLDFYKRVQKKARLIAIKELANKCIIKKSRLGADAGAVGAALLALGAKA